MGAALCTCAGRADDEPHGLFRQGSLQKPPKLGGARFATNESSLLQTQSRTETRELLSDEEREAIRNSVRGLHHHQHQLHHGGVYGYTLPPDDHADATESDEIEYYTRQQQGSALTLTLPRRRSLVMNPATADAFRSKLREPIMSPRSKMQILIGEEDKLSDGQDTGSQSDQERPVDGNDDSGKSETSSDRDLRRLRTESAVYDVDPAADDEDEEEEEEEEEYFEFVRIIVPPGPCGVVFHSPKDSSMAPTVEGFVRMYDGTKGPIENSGLVRPGSTLCAINDLEVADMPLSEVIRALNLSSHLEREFVFRK